MCLLAERLQIKRNSTWRKLRAQRSETGQANATRLHHEPAGALYQLNLVTGSHPKRIQDSCGEGDLAL